MTEPILIESETSNLDKHIPEQKTRNKKLPSMVFKTIIFSLIIIIVAEIVIASKTLSSPINFIGKAAITTPVKLEGGLMKLTSDKQSVKVGETVSVNIVIDTFDQQVLGADAVLKYDPQVLEVSAKNRILKGPIFDEYPLFNISSRDSTIEISGISGLNSKGFKGSGEFAKINFKARKAGNVILSLQFEPGATSDSNMIEHSAAKDILESVQNLRITVAN